MKIVHVIENLNRGGLERVVIDLLTEQVSRGNEAIVICLFEKGSLAGELESQGIKVYSCNKASGIDFKTLRQVRVIISGFRPDVLHTHNPVAHYYTVLSTIGCGVGTIINTRHGMGAFPLSIKRETIFRLTMPFTKSVVSVCKEAEAEFVKNHIVPSSKSIVITNGISTEQIEPRSQSAKEQFLKENGFEDVKHIIATVGRLNPAKDHETLIQAFAEIVPQESESLLVIVGGGALYDQLMVYIKDNNLEKSVLMLGDRGDVKQLLGCFDIFALSSITEGYSIALLEACAAALPIIATDVGGNHGIVKHDINGLLVPAKEPKQLGDALLFLLNNDEICEKMGSSSRKWVMQKGSIEAMCNAYLNEYIR